MKLCGKCRNEKQLCEFGKDRTRPGGLKWQCLECSRSMRADAANKEKQRAYRAENRDKAIAYHRDRYARTRPERRPALSAEEKSKAIREYKARWHAEKMQTDPVYALKRRYRKRIAEAIRRRSIPKEFKTGQVLGCDWPEYKKYLEHRFQPGMTWENAGEWHIDHVIPLDLAKTEDDLIILLHHTNTQPLWAFENLSKGARI